MTEKMSEEFLLQHFGIPPVDLAPGKVLQVVGQTKQRLVSTHDFFILAGAVGWIGQITWNRLPGRGRRWHWKITYRGPWVQQYADLIGHGRWPETISVEADVELPDGKN